MHRRAYTRMALWVRNNCDRILKKNINGECEIAKLKEIKQ